jgi:hypothetical protein
LSGPSAMMITCLRPQHLWPLRRRRMCVSTCCSRSWRS